MSTKADKVQQVEELSGGLKESRAVVFTDYTGLSVREVSELRKKLRELSAEFKVIKNTLISLAADKAQLPAADLGGPTAVLLSRKGDPIECIKAVVSFLKGKGKGTIKSGIFEGALKSAADVSELALIPSKAVLEGRLVGMLNAPISRFVNVMCGNQRSLVSVLSEVAKRRGGEN